MTHMAAAGGSRIFNWMGKERRERDLSSSLNCYCCHHECRALELDRCKENRESSSQCMCTVSQFSVPSVI